MTRRIDKPDTPADLQLRDLLEGETHSGFTVVAGAGSGKTTSLVKALDFVARTRGPEFRRRGQQIACITYTDIAVREIWGDVGNMPLFHISTIHSFLWAVISPFQPDIKAWVRTRLNTKIDETSARLANPKTKAATRPKLEQDLAKYRSQLAAIGNVARFVYGTGSDYANGVLGHSDVLEAGPELIANRTLLQTIVARRFPVIFVDESQDTSPEVVAALRMIEESAGGEFCLGFFGDPMQKIYLNGAGQIAPGNGWLSVTKPENFRCPQRVLSLVNSIRAEDDGLQQTRGRTVITGEIELRVDGSARIFILPADERRTQRLSDVRQALSILEEDALWLRDTPESEVKVLVIVHRMAATRLGFPMIYSSLNDDAPSSLREGLLDGTAWVLRPFLNYLLPLVLASRAGSSFEVISLLRVNCPSLLPERIAGLEPAALLRRLKGFVTGLEAMLAPESRSTIGDVIEFVRRNELLELDERFVSYFETETLVPGSGERAVTAFFQARATELWGYREYIEGHSPFSTQQGIKGSEFQRVLTVLDDEEGSYNLFSYGKYFGTIPLSGTDEENIASGKDSVVGRTRRLFYVCCSRAVEDLAVVFFVPNVEAAKQAVIAKNFFREQDIIDANELDRLLTR